jgi:hypothetical protein
VPRSLRIFHRWQFVRHGIERRIGLGDRRGDFIDRAQIIFARIHAELLRRMPQFIDGRFLEHGVSPARTRNP